MTWTKFCDFFTKFGLICNLKVISSYIKLYQNSTGKGDCFAFFRQLGTVGDVINLQRLSTFKLAGVDFKRSRPSPHKEFKKMCFLQFMLMFFLIAEQELLRLQQEYRIMEGDRKAYSEESQNIIRKQKAAITSLQAENEELMKDNYLAGSQQNENKVGLNF